MLQEKYRVEGPTQTLGLLLYNKIVQKRVQKGNKPEITYVSKQTRLWNWRPPPQIREHSLSADQLFHGPLSLTFDDTPSQTSLRSKDDCRFWRFNSILGTFRYKISSEDSKVIYRNFENFYYREKKLETKTYFSWEGSCRKWD